MLCPSCASPIAEGARFCSSCGHAVAAVQSEERRIVTVLFADVVGFTSLAEHRDPETVKRLIDRIFARLAEVITGFGGRVDKLLGDGVLALFGAPVAHEDDAERAVRAALRMHETLAAYSDEQALEPPLRMRIGINTGEVLMGTLAGADYTAMGDVVNTASRLQAAAPPGGVLVGEATYALTADIVRYDESSVLQPRGREQSVNTWLALDMLAPPGFRLRRSDLRLVGRSAELGLVHAALRLVAAEGRSLVLNITGEGGVGKSRLVEEVVATLEGAGLPEALVLEGACAPYGESNAWSPIAMALATAATRSRWTAWSKCSPTWWGIRPRSTGSTPRCDATASTGPSPGWSNCAPRVGRWCCGSTICTGPTKWCSTSSARWPLG
jgi:class 3 adenylate cyclase